MTQKPIDIDALIKESGITQEEIEDAERSLAEQIRDADMLAGGGISGQTAKIESLEGWRINIGMMLGLVYSAGVGLRFP